jgi:hypothetical protein
MSSDTPEKLSPEEQRRQMKQRFDAANTQASQHSDRRRDEDTIRQADEKERRDAHKNAQTAAAQGADSGNDNTSDGS